METQFGRKLPPKVNPYIFGIGIVVIFLGLILGAQLFGIWSTSGRLTPSGAPVQLTGKDPAEIKGWMKLEDITTSYNIPLADILTAFKLPDGTPGSAAIKDLEGQGQNFSVITLRDWIAQKLGKPLPVTAPGSEPNPTPKSRNGNKTPGA